MKNKKLFLKIMLAIIVMCLSVEPRLGFGQIVTDTIAVGDTIKITEINIYGAFVLVPANSPSSTIYLFIEILGATNFSWYGSCTENCNANLIAAHYGGTYYCDFDYGGPQGLSCGVHYIPNLSDTILNYLDTISLPHFASYQWFLDGNLVSSQSTLTVEQSGTCILITTDQGGSEGRDTFNITCTNFPYNLLGSTTTCPGGTGEITLDSSEVNIDYVLKQDSISVDTVAGTGYALSFGLWPPSHTYTCDGIGALGTTTMNGTVVVDEYPIYHDTINASICNGDSILLGGAYQYVAGSYYDSLSTVNGCDSIIVTQLTVQQPLTAGFNYLANNLDVTFTNTSSNSTNSYWDFGDGTTSNDINPLHTYSQNGYFHILLTVFDSTSTICNTQATASADIEVGTGTSCVSGFSYNITTKSTNVLFTDTSHSNGNIHQWYWDFGDGTTSNLQNPQHHFTHNGYFNVSLTIQDTINDCVDDCQQTIEIGISDTTSDCEASFSYYVNNNNRKAWFTNTSLTIDPIINAIWSFGDGDISTLLNPLHQYQTEGYYEVCLTIYTGTCTNISCQTILVGNPSACWADMIYTVDLPTNTVYFSNISYGMIPTSFNWNFGDGGQSNVENPVHTYPDSGTYHVHYHIKNLPDCNSHINVIVNLNPTILLASGFIVIPDSSSNKSTEYPVDFYGASFGDPSTLLWEFGDGTTDSTAWRITHAYQDSGTYQVCLTVSDLYLGAYTYCDSVYVGDIISDSHIHTVPKPEIRIYPNPTQDWLQIDGVENNIMIKLTDIVGKEIMVIKNTNKIDISHISPGTYLLVIQTDTQRTVLILIKE